MINTIMATAIIDIALDSQLCFQQINLQSFSN